MKNFSTGIIAAFVLASCNQTATELKERIAGADSIAINYFNPGGKMDSVMAVAIIRDTKALEQLTNTITHSKSSVTNNCGYDGSIHFFKRDMVVQDVFFASNSKEGCSQFLFSLNGNMQATKLTEEAKVFLAAIKNK